MLPAALSSSVTIFARASAAAMNSSSRSFVLRETKQPRPTPAEMCGAGLGARHGRVVRQLDAAGTQAAQGQCLLHKWTPFRQVCSNTARCCPDGHTAALRGAVLAGLQPSRQTRQPI